MVGSGNTEDLALVGVYIGGSFIGYGKGWCGCGRAGAEANVGGALVTSLHGVLDLEEPTPWAPHRHVLHGVLEQR